MANKIELKSIRELLRMNFYIPSYQRGYRWTKQQVGDLLEDIDEFINKDHEGFYCLQPLVVKREIPEEKKSDFKEKLQTLDEKTDLLQATENIISEFTKWEVIDGQQRLTTIYILLSYLNQSDLYKIEYETRPDSKSFLEKIDTDISTPNIDYFHMINARKQIEHWFRLKFEADEKNANFRNMFCENLLDNVKFIWYESVDENPVKVFTRLNVGKISLTNAELIKALFLNRSNFNSSDYQKTRLFQQEIASEWDTIEYTLQNDEFWLFFNKPEYNKPTRIDFIFDLICEGNSLELDVEEIGTIGTDEYRTFRYFYTWFKKERDGIDITARWKEVKSLFQIFQEWFNDLILYHYIGYLLCEVNKQPISKLNIVDLINEWNKNQTKEQFVEEYLTREIKKTLSNCSDLDKKYEESGSPKTQCRPILLLHNIQTIINQNKNLEECEKYKQPIFYKYPFHLFKKEKWDIEHIDSNTENPLEKETERKEWLKYSLLGIQNDELKGKIQTFIRGEKKEERDVFDDLYKEVVESYRQSKTEDRLSDSDKNKLWNFCLLDSSSNRSYGNAIFPAKRRILVGKDQGKKYVFSSELEVTEEDDAISFVPPCTKNVFLKYFNHSTNNLREWDKKDAEAYLYNIKTTLGIFIDKKEDINEQ